MAIKLNEEDYLYDDSELDAKPPKRAGRRTRTGRPAPGRSRRVVRRATVSESPKPDVDAAVDSLNAVDAVEDQGEIDNDPFPDEIDDIANENAFARPSPVVHMTPVVPSPVPQVRVPGSTDSGKSGKAKHVFAGGLPPDKDDKIDWDEAEAVDEGITVDELQKRRRALGSMGNENLEPEKRCAYPEHDEQGDGEYEWEKAPVERPVKVTEVDLDSLLPVVDVNRFAHFRVLGNRVAADQVNDRYSNKSLKFRVWRFGHLRFGISELPDEKSGAKGVNVTLSSGVNTLAERVNAFRRSPLLERFLWAIYHRVLVSKRALISVPHNWLAEMLWGSAQFPDNWRRELKGVIEAAEAIHAFTGGVSSLDRETSLLLSTAEGGTACDSSCPWQGKKDHSHIAICTGPRFLGVLAEFGSSQTPIGQRLFTFYQTASGGDGHIPSLLKMGKAKLLRGVFLPALLGEPTICGRLGALVNSLVRETTRRNTRKARKHERFKGHQVFSADGKMQIECPLLQAGTRYVGFNGNGRKRRGLGFLLVTRAKKLAECQQPWRNIENGDTVTLIDRLREAQGTLGLIVAAIDPQPEGEKRWYDLDNLAAASREVQNRVHVRIYVEANFVTRWAKAFGWRGSEPPQVAAKPPEPEHARLKMAAKWQGVSYAELAKDADISPSMMRLVLDGKRTLSPALLEFLRHRLFGRKKNTAIGGTGPGSIFGDGKSMLELALSYRRLGLSIVPMAKPTPAMVSKPTRIAWKKFQQERPSESTIRSWWGHWDADGIGIVLGPTSGLSAIDVDGVEAHHALIERVPSAALQAAPKVFSGSGETYRYHLWFQFPKLTDFASGVITPWHPKLEFRCHKCILVAPGSPHKSGNTYKWADGRSIENLVLPPMPIEVIEALNKEAAVRAARQAATPVFPSDHQVRLPDNLARLHTLTHRFLEGEWSAASDWNKRLFLAACDMCGRQVPQAVAEPALLSGARPINDEDLVAARQTIASAFSQKRVPSL